MRRARLLGLVLAATLGVGAAACEPGTACSAAGCASSVRFPDAIGPDAVRVRACLDGDCVTRDVDGPGVPEVDGEPRITINDRGDVFLVLPDADWSGPRTAVLLVRDGLGREVARREQVLELARSQPNGAGCAPVCFNGTVGR